MNNLSQTLIQIPINDTSYAKPENICVIENIPKALKLFIYWWSKIKENYHITNIEFVVWIYLPKSNFMNNWFYLKK